MKMNALRAREGFSLIEVIIAMTLLSGVLVTLAGMTFTTARRSLQVQAANSRQGVMLREVNRLSAIGYANLGAQAGCTNLTSGGETFNRCITVTASGTTQQIVRVVVTSTRNGIYADTVIFTRGNSPTTNPLCSPSC